MITQHITNLNQAFVLKDLGKISYLIGVQVQQTSQGVYIPQKKYVKDLYAKPKCSFPGPIPHL